jgi:hypothetical protein
LGELDKFRLQTYLNELAPKFSKSVLAKVRVYFNSMLDEAVELEMLVKNPAAKLPSPDPARESRASISRPSRFRSSCSTSPTAIA